MITMTKEESSNTTNKKAVRVLGWHRASDIIKKPLGNIDEILDDPSNTPTADFIFRRQSPITIIDAYEETEGNKKVMVSSFPDSYKTLNEKEFLRDVIIDGKGIWIVHFFDEQSDYHHAVDNVMCTISKQRPDINFIRLNRRNAPLVSKKLNIHVSGSSEVLAMKNREVRDRISHFGESDFFNNIDDECRMLYQWITKKIAVPTSPPSSCVDHDHSVA